MIKIISTQIYGGKSIRKNKKWRRTKQKKSLKI